MTPDQTSITAVADQLRITQRRVLELVLIYDLEFTTCSNDDGVPDRVALSQETIGMLKRVLTNHRPHRKYNIRDDNLTFDFMREQS